MKYKFEILTIVISWIIFIVWEFIVQQWAEQQPQGSGAVIRVDLVLILPILIGLTIWSILGMVKKHRKA